MIYYSGAVRPEIWQAPRPDLGFMLQPAMGNRGPWLGQIPLALDNGCFSGARTFDLRKYLRFLVRLRKYRHTVRFATAPDVVGDAVATWHRGRDVLPWIRHMGYRAAFCGQDGLESMDVPWTAFDVLFIGGTTEWKLSRAAADLVGEATKRGMWVHMGRVNSRTRLLYAMSIGCDSADGTLLAFGPQVHYPRLVGWLDEVNGPHEEAA